MAQRDIYDYLKADGRWHTNEQLSVIFKVKMGNISTQTRKLSKGFKEIDFSDHKTVDGHTIRLFRYDETKI